MGNWGNTDDAANSVLWATAEVKLPANSANRAALYGNTTADAFITDAKIGQFAVSSAEAQALRAGANTKVAHAGWVLRREGTGGRAGRVMNETLVSMHSISNDGSDDAVIPDFKLRISTQPSSASGNATADDIVTFTAAARSTPSGASISYQWQYWNGATFLDLSNAGYYSNVTTASLSVEANAASNGEVFRVRAEATGAASVNSSNAVLTVTT